MGSRLGTVFCAAILIISVSAAPMTASESDDSAEERMISVIETVSHDHDAFTQGLEIFNGILFESTGLYGHSGLRKVDTNDGSVISQVSIDETYFGEGITIFNDSVIMLTWKNGTALVFDSEDLSVEGEFSYQGEGWGICFNGDFLVMSNGTSWLTFRDPASFEVSHMVPVTWDGNPVTRLNELECVGDLILANVWLQDEIVAINSTTGKVEFSASAGFLSQNQGTTANEVLNGIAYDSSRQGFWITGKNWTEMYLVTFDSQTGDLSFESDNKSKSMETSSELLVIVLVLIFFVTMVMQRKMPNFKDPPMGDDDGDG
jgi:glutaminyl-peptide cyclotransferase